MNAGQINPYLDGFRAEKNWKENNKPKALIFYHIPKCAGTSFTQVLRKNFKLNYSVHGYNEWAQPLPDSYDTEKISVTGHDCLGVHVLFPEFQPYYITFLRKPAERMLSHFRQQNKHQFSKANLESFCRLRIHSGVLNFLGCNSYDLAWCRLVDGFDSFGLVEDYSKSLQYFQERYELNFLSNDRVNATKKSDDYLEQLELVEKVYKSYNPDEVRFYDEAQKVFAERTKGFTFTQKKPDVVKKTAQKPKTQVLHFDPFKEIKEEAEKHLINRDYDQALKLYNSLPEKTPFLAERLSQLYKLNGDDEKAVYWAEKKLDGFFNSTDFMNLLDMKRAINRDESYKYFIKHLQRFEMLPTACPDSSLNRNLFAFAQTLCEWCIEDLKRSSMAPSKHNLWQLLNKYITLDMSSNREYWLGFMGMVIEFYSALNLEPVPQ